LLLYASPVSAWMAVSARMAVSAWTANRLSMSKPPWHRTMHPGLLSRSHPSVGRQFEYPATAAEVIRHFAWYTSLYLRSCSVELVYGWRTSLTEISADEWKAH